MRGFPHLAVATLVVRSFTQLLFIRRSIGSRFCQRVFGALLAMAQGIPAQACYLSYSLDPDDVAYADIVVVGRVEDYSVNIEMFGNSAIPIGRFDIAVEHVLKGSATETLSVAMENTDFGLRESLPDGSLHLMALRYANSTLADPWWPDNFSPFIEVLSSLYVLRRPCAPPFFLDDVYRRTSSVWCGRQTDFAGEDASWQCLPGATSPVQVAK